MPDPRPVEPRRLDGAADVGSLVALGMEEPPPKPAPPAKPVPPPDTADQSEAAALNAALANAGIETTDSDKAAVAALATLDAATVATVEKWLKAKSKDSPGK